MQLDKQTSCAGAPQSVCAAEAALPWRAWLWAFRRNEGYQVQVSACAWDITGYQTCSSAQQLCVTMHSALHTAITHRKRNETLTWVMACTLKGLPATWVPCSMTATLCAPTSDQGTLTL